MENFIVSARKYRPATFETVVGQQHITGTLKNAIKNNQLAQAFLFCGPRGVGKTTCARILAKTINCTQLTVQQEACGLCESCVTFQTGHSFNFHELDAASNNSVDDIRSLTEQVRIPPQGGKYKVYIIDEVHMLSTSAFNAFLKTLEEPPPYAIFILATTEKHKILPTILSRCQIFDFNRIQVQDITQHLVTIAQRESITVETEGLDVIAQKADGGLRDALSMFDQIVSYTNKNVTYKAVIENLNILDYDYYFKLTDYLTTQNVSQALILFDEVLNNGFDGNNFINGLASHLRNLLVGKDAQTIKLLAVSETIKQKYINQSQQTDLGFLLTALNLANQCDLIYKNSKNQRLQVELALIKMCHITSVIQLAQQPLLQNSATEQTQDKKKTNLTKQEIALPIAAVQAETTIVAPSTSASTLYSPPAQSKINTIAITQNTGNKNTGMLIPSLTDLNRVANTNILTEPAYIYGEEKEDFTLELLLNLWATCAQKAKDDNKIHLYTLLTSNEPVLTSPTQITVIVENAALESTLQAEKVALLNFLRSSLKNFDLDLVAKKASNTKEKKIYTSTDKYKYLLEKNPKLAEMRQRFNLEINP